MTLPGSGNDGQIKVNFSAEEANSEARTFDAIPTGEYVANITKIEQKKVKAEKPSGEKNDNAGKPWWNVQLKLTDANENGEYKKRVLFASCMLFDGALYSTAQLLKACGYENAIASGSIPAPDKLLGKEVVVVVQRLQDKFNMKKDPSGTVIWKNDVKGFKPVGGAVAKAGSSSMLPG